jgi:hypothetical protein
MLAFLMPGSMELIIIGVIVLVPVAVVVALVVALRSRKASDNNPNLKPCPPAADADDPMAKLSKLKQMLDTGLIEQEEYDATKQRILAQM